MTDRIPLDDMTSDALDALYAELEGLRQVARGYCPACGRGDAAPSVADWEQQRQRADQAEAALARVREAAALHRRGLLSTLELHAVIGPAPAAAPPRDCRIARDGGFPCLAHDHCDTCDTTPAATDTPKTACDCPPTHAGLELCPACPGRTKETPSA